MYNSYTVVVVGGGGHHYYQGVQLMSNKLLLLLDLFSYYWLSCVCAINEAPSSIMTSLLHATTLLILHGMRSGRLQAAARALGQLYLWRLTVFLGASSPANCHSLSSLPCCSLKISHQIYSSGDLSKGDLGLAVMPDRVAEFREKLETSIQYAKALGCKR